MNTVSAVQANRNEDSEGEGRQLNQIECLILISQTNAYWQMAHKLARVSLKDSSEVIATEAITLFDTGANFGNYVSLSFIEKYNLQYDKLPDKLIIA